MRTLIYLVLFSLLGIFSASAEIGKKDPFVGYYKGKIVGAKNYPLNVDKNIYAEVFLDSHGYRLRLLSQVMRRSEVHGVAQILRERNGVIPFKNAGNMELTGEINGKEIVANGTFCGKPVNMKLERMNIVSPTMGAKAPANAAILFDGKSTDKWEQAHKALPCEWEIADGAMISKGLVIDGKKVEGTIVSKEAFGPIRLHLEFKIPAEYEQHMRGRGNSGLYFGPYEIQILDSFGSEAEWDQCGSIYRLWPPQVNASLEPEAWQTYDAEFYPAKYENGKLVKNPVITLWHNGVKILCDNEIETGTNLRPENAPAFIHPEGKLRIMLQDHWHPVAFRNVWVENISEK